MMQVSPFPVLEVRLNNGDVVRVDEPYEITIDKGDPCFTVHEGNTTHFVAYRNVTQILRRQPE